MMLLGTKDETKIADLDGAIGNKYVHHDIQNELFNIMSHHVSLFKLETVGKNFCFSIMADSYTYITNKEEFYFCIRTVDDNLEKIKEDFLGFCEL